MALGPLYLDDKSAWEQARYDKGARRRLHDLREAGQLAVCVVSMAESLYSARNADELVRMRLDLSSLPYLQMSPAPNSTWRTSWRRWPCAGSTAPRSPT